jgi:hypothetical protein
MVNCAVLAQSVPWKAQPTGANHTIFIKDTSLPVVNGAALEPGDVIGVFYDSLGNLACSGYTEWKQQSTFLVAYGEDGPNKGFKSGEVFKFKVWKKATNCIIENVKVTYATGGILTHTDRFSPDGISELRSLQGNASSIRYSNSSFCGNAAKQSPIRTGVVSQVLFKAPTGLVIDEQTGTIDVENSQPGDYTVTFQSPVCLTQESVAIHIAAKLDLSKVSVELNDASCEKPTGSLLIDESTPIGGKRPYQFTLREVSTHQSISAVANQFTHIDAGVYELTVTDSLGCQSTWTNEIRITKKNDCIPVISPNNDGIADAFYIPTRGMARIYNRNGELKKTLTIPGEWYATDETGNEVPMGNYIIICNNQEQKFVITVIR